MNLLTASASSLVDTAPTSSEPEPTPHVDPAFLHEVLRGLALPQPTLSPRWFYDFAGSELFERLTELPEYYPTRTERLILAEQVPDMARAIGRGRTLVEYGAGAVSKTPLVIEALRPRAYLPLDISGDFLRQSADALQARFPSLPIHPMEADFAHPIRLPPTAQGPHVGFFPGSTLGNLTPDDAVALLQRMGDTLGDEADLLIGLDRVKDPAVLVPAYDDAQGLTARFNRNLLVRINRELDGTIPVEVFAHRAVWNAALARIEMHLVAQTDVTFEVAGRSFSLRAGQTIHTENSHKYSEARARAVLDAGGWAVTRTWTDPQEWFSVILAHRHPRPRAQ